MQTGTSYSLTWSGASSKVNVVHIVALGSLLLTCAGLSIIVYGFNVYQRWRFRHIPGPRPTWLGGNLDQLNVPFDSHTMINQWASQYGPLYKFFVGHTPVVILTDPDLVKQVGTKSFMKFHNRPQPIMRFHHGYQTEFEESGMLFAKDKFWAGIRATCEKLFHSHMLRAHAPLINQAAARLADRFGHEQQPGPLQINDAVAGMTMEVIGEAAFGVDFGAQKGSKSPIVQQAQSLFQPPNSSGFAAMRFLMFAFPFIVPVMYRVFIWMGAKRIQQVMQAKGYIMGTSQRLLHNAREASAGLSASSTNSNGSSCSSEDEADSETTPHNKKEKTNSGGSSSSTSSLGLRSQSASSLTSTSSPSSPHMSADLSHPTTNPSAVSIYESDAAAGANPSVVSVCGSDAAAASEAGSEANALPHVAATANKDALDNVLPAASAAVTGKTDADSNAQPPVANSPVTTNAHQQHAQAPVTNISVSLNAHQQHAQPPISNSADPISAHQQHAQSPITNSPVMIDAHQQPAVESGTGSGAPSVVQAQDASSSAPDLMADASSAAQFQAFESNADITAAQAAAAENSTDAGHVTQNGSHVTQNAGHVAQDAGHVICNEGCISQEAADAHQGMTTQRTWVPSWYRATHRADALTGQGSTPQPWWRLDSWLTAPAEGQFQRGRAEGGAAYEGQVPEDHSLLYSLMNAQRKDDGQPLSDLHICAQAFTFVLAGYETTSTAISYALYEIARNPAVQQRLHEEVDGFGADREPSFDDLSSFPYTEAVFQEGMRLHPPVTPFIALIRECSEEVELGGHKLPAGTKVGINVLGMHHDPTHFPEPQEFRPERFLDGPQGPSARHPYAYIPFGVGPRKCIGHKFAMEEGIIALVRLMQRFSFSLDAAKHGGKRLQHNSLITYSPRDGIWLNIQSRSAQQPTANS